MSIHFGGGLKGRKTGNQAGGGRYLFLTGHGNHPLPAVMSGRLELLAQLGRILNVWDTEFTRAAEEAQVRSIEQN